jgi:hypothetical protein
MRHPSEMKKQGVGRQPQASLFLRSFEEILRRELECIRVKVALATVTDGANSHTVVAIDA